MRRPGVTVGVCGVGSIFGEGFGQEQKIGGHGQRIAKRNAASDVEQWLIRAVDGGCQANGFEFSLFGL